MAVFVSTQSFATQNSVLASMGNMKRRFRRAFRLKRENHKPTGDWVDNLNAPKAMDKEYGKVKKESHLD